MILNYKLTTSRILHPGTSPAISCLDVNTDLDDLIVAGGIDGSVLLYNKAQDKVNNHFRSRLKHFRSLTHSNNIQKP